MMRVRVEVAPAYDVLIGEGVLAQLGQGSGRVAVVIDEAVQRLHGARVDAALAGRPSERFILPSGERHKTLRTAEALYDWLAAHRFERRESLVAVGGGVCGDLTGFVAATWRRGVPFIQVPTTLLAQVDASVGGKVAVDHPAGKNLIGAFHQPAVVLADRDMLSTLPPREMWSGLAEVVKTALLTGEPLFSQVAEQIDALARGEASLDEVIAACVIYKAGVVQRDPHEHGERAVLNLGHTVGHAIEKLGGYEQLLHGEAVTYGLRAALALSGTDRASPAWKLVKALKVPPLPAMKVDDVLDAMRSDKKVAGGRIYFVLLEVIGQPRWGCELPPDRVRDVVTRVLAGDL